MTKEEILKKISEMLGLKQVITESDIEKNYELFLAVKKSFDERCSK
jgi:hypothetical protein